MTMVQPWATILVLPAMISMLGSYMICREEQDDTLKSLLLIPLNETALTAAKMIVTFVLNASCTTIFREQYSISQQADQPLTEIQQDDLYFCLEQRLVIVRGQVIPLTVKEFEIFALLILNPKRVFTYEMLLDLVWHEDYTYYSRKAINNHVSNLRKKIRIAPDLPDYVKSVYGVGYKFDI